MATQHPTARRELCRRGEVLVAIINSPSDLDIARQKHWYRIPVRSVQKFLQKRWPPGRESASEDNERDNELTSKGWDILRFRGQRIREELGEYCIPKIMATVNQLDGLEANGLVPRPFDPQRPEAQQLTLFEPGPEYDLD